MNQQEIEVNLPNGEHKSFALGSTIKEIAGAISPGLKKRSVVAKLNGVLVDLEKPVVEDADLILYDLDSAEGLHVMRHSAAHILAQAIQRLYPDASFGVGPVIEHGFYYDVDVEVSLTEKDLERLEKEMNKIVSENLAFRREEISREEANRRFAKDPLKQELIQGLPEEMVLSVYHQGEFMDLCRGPHVPSTHFLKAFKLTHVSGAYWRGDSQNQMLQRIYGVAFASKRQLKEYEQFVEEAHRRNHRKIGKELELFMFSEEAPGMPFYLPNGQIIRNELEAFLRDLQTSYDYKEVRTPTMMNQRLWEQSGHWDHYKENMYFSQVDEQTFALKPMNCPGHMLIYKNGLHSYRDLPIRMAEFGQVHRHEFSGALNGMLRVRSFCQDDAHIFVTPNQIEDEITLALQIIDHVYRIFGFTYEIELSTRPESYMGERALWDQAEAALENVLKRMNFPYRVNEGDGAFYGPKIDIHINDAIKRSHQCATIQLDFQLPQKFDLTYINEDNDKARPVVIHRAVFGSIDRFFGILIEHFAGVFPVWLAPVQVQVIAVSSSIHGSYAQSVQQRLRDAGIRAEVDLREEKLGYKMREAQLKKIPYIVVVGDEEANAGTVHVRRHGEKNSVSIELEGFMDKVVAEIEEKQL
ncbi:threonine--tRNA ligase [Chryseomicrobium palamuruense]|uniref:Threonine--tRNA ligase n=1 Tax=Chryseomicrobium palamuruense TaxID=682973 RepID=A0ABV8UWL6_9BACL